MSSILELFKFDRVDANLHPNWLEAVLSLTPPPTLLVDDEIHTVPSPCDQYGDRGHYNSPAQVSAALDEYEGRPMEVEMRLMWKRPVV